MDERLNKFLGAKVVFRDEERGYEIELKPFKGKDLDKLLNLSENMKADDIKNLVYDALSNSGYEVAKSDIDEFEMGFITWIATCVGKVNGTSE